MVNYKSQNVITLVLTFVTLGLADKDFIVVIKLACLSSLVTLVTSH